MPDALTMEGLVERMRGVRFAEQFDAVVAIANGGCVPGALLAEQLGVPLEVLRINWRGADNVPCRERPLLLRKLGFDVRGRRFLVVDDRSKTGATFAAAGEVLREAGLVRTFCVNGNADYFLFNGECFRMPWRHSINN